MKDYCKILGFLLFAEILTLFINVTLAFSGSFVFRIVTSICTLGILIGLMAQAGHSIGNSDRKLLKQQPDAVRSSKPHMLGMLAMFPYELCWIFLLLAKIGVVDGGFYRFYKLLCAPFLQVCNLMCDDVTAAALPVWGLVVLQLLCFVPFFSVWVSYKMTVRGENLENVMYE